MENIELGDGIWDKIDASKRIEKLTLQQITERYPLTEQEIKKLKEMTESKYYTPSIEEFHVGFEYEMLDHDFQGQSDGGEWKKRVFDRSTLMDTLQHWKHFQDYRVKCLDRQDIEECGWKKATNDMYDILDYKDPRGHFDTVHLIIRGTWVLISVGRKNTDINTFPTIFAGNIKNKSELKRVMKMLCIDQKD